MPKLTIKAARVNAGYTQKRAAKEVGVSPKTLSSWENNKSYPDVDKFTLLCQMYAVNRDDITFLR